MGECEGTGRLRGEIVEVYRAPRRSGGDPREVVEVYRQPDGREVVEVYSRPVPGRAARPASAAPPSGGRRSRKRGLWVFLACLMLMAALAAVSRLIGERPFAPGRRHGGDYTNYTSGEITIPGWPVDQGASLVLSREPGEELTAQEVYRRLNPAVVTVTCRTEEGFSMGTGVVFTEDGYVITNYHVVRGGSQCSVILNTGYTMEVRYVAGDEDSDLAVLKVPTEELRQVGGLPAAIFGDSEQLVVGDPVYAIGAPRQLRGTLTNGIISAINRDIEVEGREMTLLQTNAALNSGNSGGPLINARGQVIGINVAKYMSSLSGEDSVEGLGFAIPSAQMERIVNDLLKWGAVQPEPQLGIMVIGPAFQLEDGTEGLLVDSVNLGSAAERAGVQAGDYILAAEGEPTLTTEDLFRVRRRLYVGDTLTLTLWREGETLEVTLELNEAAD